MMVSGHLVAIKKFVESEDDPLIKKIALREIRFFINNHHHHHRRHMKSIYVMRLHPQFSSTFGFSDSHIHHFQNAEKPEAPKLGQSD